MLDYSKGKIYKIWDIHYTKCYVGSTVETLNNRFAKHKDKYKHYLNKTHFFTTVFGIFDEFGVENCKIELVENCSVNSKEELLAKEGEHIRACECVNRCVAGRTQKKYREEFPEFIKHINHQHYQDNRQYRLEQVKEYARNNPDKVKETKRKQYEKIKDKKYTCECGATVLQTGKSRHLKTNKHQQYLQNQNTPQE